MSNIYEQCPVLENERWLMRFVKEEDSEDLQKVYGDKQALPFFNSDNCHEDNFYYDTKEKMDNAIRFWLESYEGKWFVRLTIIDKHISKAIGTIEMFHRPSDDEFDGDGLIRLDVRSDYEKSDELQEIFALLIPEAYDLLDCEEIITKIPLYALERIDAAKKVDEPIAALFNEKVPQGETYAYPPRSARTYRFVRRDGKTFVLGNDGVTTIWEYLDNEKRLKPRLMVGSSGFYSHMIGRAHTCAAIKAAYETAFPNRTGDQFKYDEETLMVWRDRNGNERFDVSAFTRMRRGENVSVCSSNVRTERSYITCEYFSCICFSRPSWSSGRSLNASLI